MLYIADDVLTGEWTMLYIADDVWTGEWTLLYIAGDVWTGEWTMLHYWHPELRRNTTGRQKIMKYKRMKNL